MLLRMVGRFSCCSLQTVWSSEMKETLHNMLTGDSNEWVRNVSILTKLIFDVK